MGKYLNLNPKTIKQIWAEQGIRSVGENLPTDRGKPSDRPGLLGSVACSLKYQPIAPLADFVLPGTGKKIHPTCRI